MADDDLYGKKWQDDKVAELAPQIEQQVRAQYAGRGATFGQMQEDINNKVNELRRNVSLESEKLRAQISESQKQRDFQSSENEKNRQFQRDEKQATTAAENFKAQQEASKKATEESRIAQEAGSINIPGFGKFSPGSANATQKAALRKYDPGLGDLILGKESAISPEQKKEGKSGFSKVVDKVKGMFTEDEEKKRKRISPTDQGGTTLGAPSFNGSLRSATGFSPFTATRLQTPGIGGTFSQGDSTSARDWLNSNPKPEIPTVQTGRNEYTQNPDDPKYRQELLQWEGEFKKRFPDLNPETGEKSVGEPQSQPGYKPPPSDNQSYDQRNLNDPTQSDPRGNKLPQPPPIPNVTAGTTDENGKVITERPLSQRVDETSRTGDGDILRPPTGIAGTEDTSGNTITSRQTPALQGAPALSATAPTPTAGGFKPYTANPQGSLRAASGFPQYQGNPSVLPNQTLTSPALLNDRAKQSAPGGFNRFQFPR